MTMTPLAENPAVLDPRKNLERAEKDALASIDFFRQQRIVDGHLQVGNKRFNLATIRRSLVDVESLAEAVLHVLQSPLASPGVYMVSDEAPLTVGEIIGAVRKGLGRGPGLFSVPPSLLRRIALAGRQADMWRKLSDPLVVDPSRLAANGWRPAADTMQRISRYAERGLPAK